MSGETRRILSLKLLGSGLKCSIRGLFGDEQVDVGCRQETEFHAVIAAHGVTSFEPFIAKQVGQTICQRVEIDTAIVVVEKKAL